VSAQLRGATIGDLAAIIALDDAVSDTRWPAAQLRAACENKEGQTSGILLAVSGEEICAFLIHDRVLDEGSVHSLAVQPGWRRQGLASQLLAEMNERWGAQGVNRVVLEVRASNLGAIELYQRCGFERDGVRKNYYRLSDGSREDAVLMSRQLHEVNA
jgi:[ribosomal protein S18]-alanine N-acetyltransferase